MYGYSPILVSEHLSDVVIQQQCFLDPSRASGVNCRAYSAHSWSMSLTLDAESCAKEYHRTFLGLFFSAANERLHFSTYSKQDCVERAIKSEGTLSHGRSGRLWQRLRQEARFSLRMAKAFLLRAQVLRIIRYLPISILALKFLPYVLGARIPHREKLRSWLLGYPSRPGRHSKRALRPLPVSSFCGRS